MTRPNLKLIDQNCPVPDFAVVVDTNVVPGLYPDYAAAEVKAKEYAKAAGNIGKNIYIIQYAGHFRSYPEVFEIHDII